jgi:NitT/TauT family transport system substrate-binding protein
MKVRTFFRAVALPAALVVASVTASSAQPTLTTIRFISSPSDDMRPVLYALSSGLFRKAGLDVEVQKAGSGALVAQAVIGGAEDVGKSSMSSLIAAYVRGLPFELIAPSAIHQPDIPNDGVLVATTSPIKSPLDLQGKTVACTAIGDIGYLGIRGMIDRLHGDSSTVKWVELPTSAVAVAVQEGRVDAGITTEPYMTNDLKSGKVRVLFDMLDGYPRPILESAFFATKDYVAKNRAAVSRFAKALEEGAVYSNTHPAETVPLLVSFSGMDPTVAAEMHRTITATSFDPSRIQPIIDLAAKYKIIPRAFNAREMIAAPGR